MHLLLICKGPFGPEWLRSAAGGTFLASIIHSEKTEKAADIKETEVIVLRSTDTSTRNAIRSHRCRASLPNKLTNRRQSANFPWYIVHRFSRRAMDTVWRHLLQKPRGGLKRDWELQLGWRWGGPASLCRKAEWHPEKVPEPLSIPLCKEWVKKVKSESHCWLVRCLSGSSIFCTHIRSRVQNSQYLYESWAW